MWFNVNGRDAGVAGVSQCDQQEALLLCWETTWKSRVQLCSRAGIRLLMLFCVGATVKPGSAPDL